MRVRVVNKSAIAELECAVRGIQLISVGTLAHYAKSGDGFIVYETRNEWQTCNVTAICEVISVDTNECSLVLDVRPFSSEITPDSHARYRWENPFLCVDKSKVRKYGFLELFADAFSDDSWKTRKLEDATNFVFRPDLSLPTLRPTEGNVYLIKGPSLHKIGKAIDVEARLKQIRRDVKEHLEVIHVFKSKDYTRAEIQLHVRFAPKRIWGEWFDLDTAEIEQICSIADFSLDS
jgi:Meiotically up-regulated gene 113